ncbi:MAG: ankyrin repeat domain-containing protein [Puniceicoccales bacterium]|jgi:hypothetical protein|nr:ankyrin repeat domain-containing protein [Puniceicoccales bacterium]
MVRYIQKKLFGYMGYGLLMLTGTIGNVAYGSQNDDSYDSYGSQDVDSQVQTQQINPATERIPNGYLHINMDMAYLDAVQRGDIDTVDYLLENFTVNPNAVDDDGNTDLMLAIRGGGQSEWGDNYQVIFASITSLPNRNWNAQNNRKQTALLLAVGWGRLDCIDQLLEVANSDTPNAVNPNIPNIDKATPLMAAIGHNVAPIDLKVAMALRFINHPLVNVNQRGTDNKLPLEIAFIVGLADQLFHPICRRTLMDYNTEVKNIAQYMKEHFSKGISGGFSEDINYWTLYQDMIMLLNNQMVDVNDPLQCSFSELTNAILTKINPLLEILERARRILPELSERLNRIRFNTHLYKNLILDKNHKALSHIFRLS